MCCRHRDCSIHIERECSAVSTFAKRGYFVRQICFYYFFTTQILVAVAADLLYKSVMGLCLIISRAARYLPKPALNNIPSLFCILQSQWLQSNKNKTYRGRCDRLSVSIGQNIKSI